MRICFLMEPPRSKTSVTYDVLNGLQASGADVEVVTERSGLVDLQNFKFEYDLYLFKSHSPLAEALAAAAHYRGGKLFNEYPATMKVRDKVLTAHHARCRPAFRRHVRSSPIRLRRLRPIVRETPIVVKPWRGRRGQGIEVCMDEAQFDDLIKRRADDASGG